MSEPAHITSHNTGRTPAEDVAELREKYPPRLALLEQTAEKLGAAKARISTLEALTDQLAEALEAMRLAIRHYGLMREAWVEPDDNAYDAIAAYEADKEAHRGNW